MKLSTAIVIASLLASPAAVLAQSTADVPRDTTDAERLVIQEQTEHEWSLRVTPYLWIPAQEGTVAIRGNSADVSLSVADTLDTVTDNFNFAASLNLELERGRWTILADAMYLSIEAENTPLPSGTANIRQDQGIFELGAAFAALIHRTGDGVADDGISVRIEPLAGVRVHHLELEIDTSASGAFSGNQTWADAFAGVRGRVELSDRVALFARADVGVGGSDLTWNALAGVQFGVTDGIALIAGYRALDIDYSDGHGADRFRYDVTLHGPFLAATLSF